MVNEVFRIGFIIQNKTIPVWYAKTIEEASANHSVFLITIPSRKAKYPAAYSLFAKFEKMWFSSAYLATAASEIAAKFQPGQMIEIDGLLSEKDQAAIELLNLDIVYSIDYDFEPENISGVVKAGLWFISFGFENYSHSKPPGFWEVMEHSPVSGSYLLIKKQDDTRIAFESTTPTVPYSVQNNFNSMAWKASGFLGYRLREMEKIGINVFLKKYSRLFQTHQGAGVPGNFKMLFLFTRNILRYFLYKIKGKITHDRFSILFAKSAFDLETSSSLQFTSIPLPKNRFWADPFVITGSNKQFIFFEEYDYQKKKAHISVMEIDDEGRAADPKIVLEKDHHLSYPNVFTCGDDHFMIPETSANKTIELYKAHSFPFEWKMVKTLPIERILIDVTLLFHNNKWWLFGNAADHHFVSTNDQLFLYYSDDLLSGDWIEHPSNPIVTHAANARPAGKIFSLGEKLYRPSQNNASFQYGYGIKINEILEINEKEYFEKEVMALFPENFMLKAMHTLNWNENITVIDGIAKK